MYAINRRFALFVALKENLLAVGGKNRRSHGRIRRPVLAQRQLALRSAQQQQNVRRRLVTARAHEYRGVAVGVEMHELAGLSDKLVLVGVGCVFADSVELRFFLRETEIKDGP